MDNKKAKQKKTWIKHGQIKHENSLKFYDNRNWHIKHKYLAQSYTKIKFYCYLCKSKGVDVKIKVQMPHEETENVPVFMTGVHSEICDGNKVKKKQIILMSLKKFIHNIK